jgi:hypothetical protein
MKNSTALVISVAPARPLTAGLDQFAEQAKDVLARAGKDFIALVIGSLVSGVIALPLAYLLSGSLDYLRQAFNLPISGCAVAALLWFVAIPLLFSTALGYLKTHMGGSAYWHAAPMLLMAAWVSYEADLTLSGCLELLPWIALTAALCFAGMVAGDKLANKLQVRA